MRSQMNTRPYTRSVFGADTGLGAIDPPNLNLDMGPYAGSPINPHAFASGHQYGTAIGLRGVSQYLYNPNFWHATGDAISWATAPFQTPAAAAPAAGVAGLGQQFVMQSRKTGRLGATMPPTYNTGAAPVPQLTQSFVYDPSGKPAAVVTPTVPVIPAQTAVMPTGTQVLAVGAPVAAPAHVNMGLVLAGLAAGVLIAATVRHMVH